MTLLPDVINRLPRAIKHKYLLLVIARGLMGILDVLGIALIGLIASVAANFGSFEKPIKFIGLDLNLGSKSAMAFLVAVVFSLFIVKALVVSKLSKSISLLAAQNDAREALLIARYFFRGTQSQVKSRSRAEIHWAIGESTAQRSSMALLAISTLVADGCILIFVSSLFFLVDPVASLCVLLYFSGIGVILQYTVGAAQRKVAAITAKESQLGATRIDDAINSFREIFVSGHQDVFVDKIMQSRTKLASGRSKLYYLGSLPKYVVETALMLGVLTFVSWQFMSGNLESSFAIVGIFLAGGVRIMGAVIPLQNSFSLLRTSTLQGKEAGKVLDELSVSNVENAFPVEDDIDYSGNGLGVDFKSVHFAHDKSQGVGIRDLTLSILPGSYVAVIGPSGAGKTTFADLLLGILPLDHGEITYVKTKSSNEKSGIFQLGYVPQKPGIITGSILENIAIGESARSVDFDRLYEVIKLSNLEELVDSYKDGVHTEIGAGRVELSGGQAQRLGLARALYPRPNLLVLDEATSALDADSEAFIASTLEGLKGKLTLIVIAHRLSTVQHADVVHLLESGTLTASGTFSELRKKVPLIERYVELMTIKDS